MSAFDFKPALRRIVAGEVLDGKTTEAAIEALISGDVPDAVIGGFLIGLAQRGEDVGEIAATVRVLRRHMVAVSAPTGAIDMCGTGGDGQGTWNISTAAALIAAACGVKVAKHGNRALSSLSGSAEVLAELGVNINASPQTIARSIEAAGIGFMFAPAHHPAMKHVGAARAALGVRTIFNLAGPLSNPAGVKRQLMGVPEEKWLMPMAQVLKATGAEKAWVVHGTDGLDELTLTGASHVAELAGGALRQFTITPEDAGLPIVTPEALRGGSPKENANAIRVLLAGEKTPLRDIACLNAAAALIVSDKADNLKQGVAMAAQAIDDGKAAETLKQLAEATKA